MRNTAFVAISATAALLPTSLAPGQATRWTQTLTLRTGPQLCVVPDVNDDGWPEALVLGNNPWGPASYSGLLISGNDGVTLGSTQENGELRTFIGVSDINGDGSGDFVSAHTPSTAPDEIKITARRGDPPFLGALIWEITRRGRYLSLTNLGDLNGDGRDELALVTASGAAYPNDQRHEIIDGYSSQVLYSLPRESMWPVGADLDGDFLTDYVLCSNPTPTACTIYSGARGIPIRAAGAHGVPLRDLHGQHPGYVVRRVDLGTWQRVEVRDILSGDLAWNLDGTVGEHYDWYEQTSDCNADGWNDLFLSVQTSTSMRLELRCGLSGNLLASTVGPPWLAFALPGVPGHYLEPSWSAPNLTLRVRSLVPSPTLLPREHTPRAAPWETPLVLRVEGEFTPSAQVYVGAVPLLSPVVTPTRIEGTLPEALGPGVSPIEVRDSLVGRTYTGGQLHRLPTLTSWVGGSARIGGFIRIEVRGEPTRPLILWASIARTPVPLAMPPYLHLVLTDPTSFHALALSVLDSTGRFRMGFPFPLDPALGDVRAYLQALVIQVLPQAGSFTNLSEVHIPR